jgi:hypothetical protein
MSLNSDAPSVQSGNTEEIDAPTTWFLGKEWNSVQNASTAEEASEIAEGTMLTTGVVEDPNKIAADKGQLVPESVDSGSAGFHIPILSDIGKAIGGIFIAADSSNPEFEAQDEAKTAFLEGHANMDYLTGDHAPEGWMWRDGKLVRRVKNVELSGYTGGNVAGGKSGYF